MLKNNIKTIEQIIAQKKSGLILLIISLLLYFLVKLPFNLSVTCASSNEGFYFVFSQYLLDMHKFDFIRGPLFIFIYAFVLKLLGFNTYSIVAIHFLQTFTVIMIGISLFYLGKVLLKSSFFAGLTVLFWILLQLTPIGGWGAEREFESTFALEGEYFCVLFSVWSLICLLNVSGKNKSLYFLAGIYAGLSFASKASGIIIVLAFICWCFYLLLFFRNLFLTRIFGLFVFIVGFLLCVLLFSFALSLLNVEPLSFWRDSFLIGSYLKNYLSSPSGFFASVIKFMTRDSKSLSNLILFFLAFISILWGFLRICILKIKKNDFTEIFWSLLSIWGIGNIFAVISPGVYGSYYYILVWPAVSIFISLFLRDLILYVSSFQMKIIKVLITVFILFFFVCRISIVFPAYCKLARFYINLNIFSQPQSFQDPVILPYSPAPKNRTLGLKISDLINSLLPNKNDKFYIFNFFKNFPPFSPNIYIYAKRPCQTSILSDHLLVKNICEDRAEELYKVLTDSPPKIIVLPRLNYISKEALPLLNPFLDKINIFFKKNYHFLRSFEVFNFNDPNEAPETCNIYERN